jgi:hypothetical protein
VRGVVGSFLDLRLCRGKPLFLGCGNKNFHECEPNSRNAYHVPIDTVVKVSSVFGLSALCFWGGYFNLVMDIPLNPHLTEMFLCGKNCDVVFWGRLRCHSQPSLKLLLTEYDDNEPSTV